MILTTIINNDNTESKGHVNSDINDETDYEISSKDDYYTEETSERQIIKRTLMITALIERTRFSMLPKCPSLKPINK